MRESNSRCRIENPASWATRRMRHARAKRVRGPGGTEGPTRGGRCGRRRTSASGACQSRSPAFRRRWSRPRAEAFEARRGVEPRSTILRERDCSRNSAPLEQVAGIEPAPSDWQTDARPSSHTCMGAESRNRTGLAALEAQSFALNKPRVGGQTRSPSFVEDRRRRATSTRSRRTESNRARSRTERLLRLGATTARLVESPGTAPGEPACKAGARPSAQPRSGPTRNRTERARFWRPRTSQRSAHRCAA